MDRIMKYKETGRNESYPNRGKIPALACMD
jgi:hypothetical protein